MPLYETVFIARQDLSADDVDALTNKLAKVVTDAKGKVISQEYWGLRDLAYKVKKNKRGHYVLLNIEADYPVIAELKRVISFNESVIRSSVFKVEAHNKESHLFASKNAKEFRADKPAKKEPTKSDLVLDQVQFEV